MTQKSITESQLQPGDGDDGTSVFLALVRNDFALVVSLGAVANRI